MDAQDQSARAGREHVEGLGVIGDAGPVGGAHLDEPAAGLREDFRNAEPSSDLDQLSPADHGGAARSERGEGQ